MSKVSYKPLKIKDQKRYVARYGSFYQANRKQYRLIYVEELVVSERSLCGCCNDESLEIYLNVFGSHILGSEDFEGTMIHEFVHAEIYQGGYRQLPWWTNEIEEITCEMFSRGIAHNFNLKFRRKSNERANTNRR